MSLHDQEVRDAYERIRELSTGQLAHFVEFEHGCFHYRVGVEAFNLAHELNLWINPGRDLLMDTTWGRTYWLPPFDEMFRADERHRLTHSMISIFDGTENETTDYKLDDGGEWVMYSFDGKECDQ